MKKNNETDALNEAIATLEKRQALELKQFKEQFHFTYESLKPVNLIKNTLHEVTSSPELKNNILNNAIGITTGYLSKKILVGKSHSPVKKLMGLLLQFVITNVVTKKAAAVNPSEV